MVDFGVCLTIFHDLVFGFSIRVRHYNFLQFQAHPYRTEALVLTRLDLRQAVGTTPSPKQNMKAGLAHEQILVMDDSDRLMVSFSSDRQAGKWVIVA
jgi:hypothetical protein